jgi:Cd2+/Zn2+-exporting ATPase
VAVAARKSAGDFESDQENQNCISRLQSRHYGGEIVEGSSSIDESPVTGESVPTRKMVGGAVFAGTINADAVLRVRITAAASDNTISRVVKLVEEAQESKAPTERFIERFSKIYTPVFL